MSLPVYKRKFRLFMSTFHANGKVVEQLEHWLSTDAGVSVLTDSHVYLSGMPATNNMVTSAALCQSMVILLSKQAIESGWVREQFEVGLSRQKVDGSGFHIIPIRVDDCQIPEFFRSSRWIDISDGLNLTAAARILFSIYSDGVDVENRVRDIYFVHSWSENENQFEDIVCKIVKNFGFQLVSSSANKQAGVDLSKNIMRRCAGGIVVIPKALSEKTLQRIYGEIEALRNLRLPFIVVAHRNASLTSDVIQSALAHLIVDETSIKEIELFQKIHPLLLLLQEELFASPLNPYIFYGTDLKDIHKDRNRLARQTIEQVSAVPCVMGEDVQHGQVQQSIIDRIINAQIMVADISKENLNTCIEAGIAIGANVPVYLISGDERHKPPFMFRDRQIWHYQNDLDLLGIVHKLALPYRRLII